MSRCHTNTVIGLRARQQVMVVKKIQQRSATYLSHPKKVERQYRHLGTVPVIRLHLPLGNFLHYLQVCPQSLLRHWETLTCSRPHALDTRLAVGVVSNSHPTKAMAKAQNGRGVTEVEIRTEKGDGVRLRNIGGHRFWLGYRQPTRLE